MISETNFLILLGILVIAGLVIGAFKGLTIKEIIRISAEANKRLWTGDKDWHDPKKWEK